MATKWLRHGWMTISGGFLAGAGTFLLSVDVPSLVAGGISAPKTIPSALLGIGVTAVVFGIRRAMTNSVASVVKGLKDGR